MFPDTQWTVLARATLHGDEPGRHALAALCRNYWEPVRLFIIQRGWPPHEAPDLAQSFFLRLMERSVLHAADRDKGRFRAFMQGVLNHFLLNELESRRAAKRGGGMERMDFHETSAVADEAEAGSAFDRRWAQALMQAAYQRTAAECAATRGREVFEALDVFIGGAGEIVPHERAAARIGMNAVTFRGEIFLWRRKLRDHLRAEVRRTVSAPHEVEEEMNYIHQLLTMS